MGSYWNPFATAWRAGRLPRAELWIAGRIFSYLGLTDSVVGHITLAHRLSLDCVFLPAGKAEDIAAGLDYRRFSPREVAAGAAAMPAGIILDGPFGRLAVREGLFPGLLSWDRAEIQAQLAKEATRAVEELSSYLIAPLKAVVIADDIAYQQSTYLSPNDLHQSLFPLYPPLVDAVHAAGAQALFHSDGKLASVMADVRASGFDGLAGCQTDCNWEVLMEAKDLLVLGGVDAPWLNSGTGDFSARRAFVGRINELSRHCRLVLCSSSGVASPAELERLAMLYRWVDEDYRV